MAVMVDLVSDNDEFELDEDNDGQVGGSSYPVLRNADAPGPSTLVRQDAVGMANGAAPSASLVGMYVEMGFPKEMVLKAVKEIGERDESALLSLLLAYTENDDSVGSCSTSRRIPQRVEDEEEEEEEDDAFDFEDWDDAVDAGQREPYSDGSGDEGFLEEMSQWDKQIKSLVDMGFPEDEANMALRRCGIPLCMYWLTPSMHHRLTMRFWMRIASVPAWGERKQDSQKIARRGKDTEVEHMEVNPHGMVVMKSQFLCQSQWWDLAYLVTDHGQ
ncbi:DNA (cytosine-5)-methyltransferase DRM2 isoform X1 [Aegilops tauschii subsp. strangulata]|uniref:DNA (cytosine-5)-methyltransferase DRM2 isoform X1 n=1 Tax=Aegilops tauschii subsp. strangulata TaxID=200361 RepID=UPI003CC89F8B